MCVQDVERVRFLHVRANPCPGRRGDLDGVDVDGLTCDPASARIPALDGFADRAAWTIRRLCGYRRGCGGTAILGALLIRYPV